MKTSLSVVLLVIVLIVGGAVTTAKKACKSGYHSWCVPVFTGRHTKTPA
jgi:hypothetical protein